MEGNTQPDPFYRGIALRARQFWRFFWLAISALVFTFVICAVLPHVVKVLTTDTPAYQCYGEVTYDQDGNTYCSDDPDFTRNDIIGALVVWGSGALWWATKKWDPEVRPMRPN